MIRDGTRRTGFRSAPLPRNHDGSTNAAVYSPAARAIPRSEMVPIGFGYGEAMNTNVEEALREEAVGNAKKAAKAVERLLRDMRKQHPITDEECGLILGWADQQRPPKAWQALEVIRMVRDLANKDPETLPVTARRFADAEATAAAAKEAAVAEERARQIGEARTAASQRMLMTTTHDVPGRDIADVITVVSGACVMSRNAISDVGSNMSSVFGGTLGGIEKAVEAARQTAMMRLEEAARIYDADAVIAIDTSVQTVSDKAQLVMLTGTAVTLTK